MGNLSMLPYSVSKDNKQKIDHLSRRVLVFVIPGRVKIGVQPNEIRVPFSGKIVDVYATCRVPGATDTNFRVQKISDSDFRAQSVSGWTDTTHLSLVADEKIALPTMELSNLAVQDNDHFRVVIDQLGQDIEDITVEVVIKMDF